MDRIELQKLNNDKNNLFEKKFLACRNPIDGVSTLENGTFDVLFDNLTSNEKCSLELKNNASARLSFFAKNELETLNVNIDVFENCELEIYYADFSSGKNEIHFNINLKEPNAKVIFHLASLTSNIDKKTFDICVNHDSRDTYGKVDNYGVCKDNSKLLFAGTSHIKNGCVKSKTYQNAKIMVFDPECIATAKPILKIDENDIMANHGAVVGKVNDEHLFYLTSRGLSEAQAKEIITFGYLKPILEGFIEEEIKDEIVKLIEGRM